jgi:hypothetical protein
MSDQHFAQIQNCVATGSQDEAQTWAGRPVRPGPMRSWHGSAVGISWAQSVSSADSRRLTRPPPSRKATTNVPVVCYGTDCRIG